jgi:succinate dehydrogenase / fumarate reductase cytochrome b subunit
MLTSILHRVTGVGLYLGAILLTIWLAAAATGPQIYVVVEGFLRSILGQLILFGFTLAAVYHLANGVRHLAWDAGRGFDPRAASRISVFILIFTVVATVAVWAAAYGLRAR